MANDGIKLPTDSTVSSQPIHRGQLFTPKNPVVEAKTPSAPVSPLMSIVLQSKPIIEGRQESLYEVIIQNDPKSAPPIKIHVDTHINPGTPLLLELDDDLNYKIVERPTKAQLVTLIKIELDYWQAHLLPKSAKENAPSLPSLSQQLELMKTYPALKPLLTWFSQRPASIDGATVESLLKTFASLNSIRPWQTTNPVPLQNTSAHSTENTQSPTAATMAKTPSPIQTETVRPITISGTDIAQLKFPLLSKNELNVLSSSSNLLKTARTTTTSPSSVLSSSSSSEISKQLNFLKPATATAVSTSPVSTEPLNSNPRAVTEMTELKQSERLINQNSTNPLKDKGAAPLVNNALTPIKTTSQKTAIEILKITPSLNQTSIAENSAITTGTLGTNKNWQTLGSPTNTMVSNETSETNIISKSSKAIINIISEGNLTDRKTTDISAKNAITPKLPLEMVLSSWLTAIDEELKQSPNHLQSQLAQKATKLLQALSNDPGKILMQQQNIASQHSSTKTEEQSLLQLRHWLETSQASLQNSAVQSAAQQWAHPEQPPIQQMHLPLIWLGLTNWADIEWWQEKQGNQKKKEQKEASERRWRMRLFLQLEPMALFCADIDWGSDHTNLTFWCKDSSTLQHLNQLMPTLESWTAGLGEKTILTKHGMPKRKSEINNSDPSSNLVDVRT